MSELKEIQQFEYQMLKDVARAFDENNIQYFLDSGTLIGAVRHSDFIPWDDDVDICMTLPNYCKFLRIGQRILGDKYFVQNYKTDKYYYEMWTKIRANGTTSMPKGLRNLDIHFGICLDVFPLVGASDNPKKRAKQKRALALNRSLLMDSYIKAVEEKLSIKQKIMYIIPRSIRRVICRMNEKRFMLDVENHSKCVQVYCVMEKEYPSYLFNEYIKIFFREDYFYSIKGYDTYLRIMYGDYMKLPPESERVGHSSESGEIIFDIKKDYKYYQEHDLM